MTSPMQPWAPQLTVFPIVNIAGSAAKRRTPQTARNKNQRTYDSRGVASGPRPATFRPIGDRVAGRRVAQWSRAASVTESVPVLGHECTRIKPTKFGRE